MTNTGPRLSRWIDRSPKGIFIAGAGLLACLVTLYFFFPRFYFWREIELQIPDLAVYPEVNRAFAALAQLNNPDAKIENPSNTVIEWRLFFPHLGRTLGMNREVFLSLTFVGCWAAASLVVAVMLRELQDRLQAICAALLVCGSAWFFVSTGWLSYNDSWVVLGLTAVAFVRSRISIAAACLTICWIDERFLLVLPTALALRTFIFPRDADWIRSFALDTATAIGASAPYLVIRLVAYFDGSDPNTAAYLSERTTETFPVRRYIEGAWAGLRCNWVYVGVWVWLAARTAPRWWSATAILGTLFSLLVVLKSAGDLHRSAAMFVIVALAGIVMLHRSRPELQAKLIMVLALLNLALPAAHVITTFKIPIYGMFDEWERSERDVPQRLRPEYYNDIAMGSAQANKPNDAITYFDYALRIDPKHRPAIFNKAVLLASRNRVPEAVAVLDTALKEQPDWPDAYFLRGRIREQMGDPRGAASDFDIALGKAKDDWGPRPEVEEHRKRLREAGVAP